VTLADEVPALQARLDVAPVSLLLDEVVEFTEVGLEFALLTVIEAAVLIALPEVPLTAVAGAHAAKTAASAMMPIAITRR
jgi:uncharacterized metal-binding protein YceD (DUF177 family)